MKNLILAILICVTALQSCKHKSANEAYLPPVKSVFTNYYEERLQLYPLEATINGDNRYNDRMSDELTEEGRAKLKEFYKKYKAELAKYDREKLSDEDKTSWDILLWECNINLAELKYPTELMPLNQFASKHLFISQMASGSSSQPFKTVKDYENWQKRVDGFIVWCDTAQVNMRKGMQQGYVLPASLIRKMIPQLADLDHGPANEHLFYTRV
jgi:uncharacterized protein (DUF885 family)